MTEERADPQADADPRVVHVPEHGRYEIVADGTRAGYAAYVDDEDGRRIVYHTEVDDRFSGRGLGGTLVSAALADTRAAGRRVVSVCPFVTRYVERHHDFDDILDPVTPAALAKVESAVRG